MKILVAGKGFIGSALGENLEKHHEVEYLDRSDADYEYDVTEEFDIEERFDLVYHCIGLPPGFASKEQYREIHVEGTRNILNGVDFGRIIYISALGAGEIDHSFHKTKKEAEEMIEEKANDFTVLRPSIIYHIENKLLGMIRKMAPTRIFPDIRTEVQPIRRDDFVEVLEIVSDISFSGNKLNIAGPERFTIGSMAEKIYDEAGYGCFLVPYPRFLIEWKIIGLSFLPPPFQKENIQLLRNDNTTDNNGANEIIDLRKCF